MLPPSGPLVAVCCWTLLVLAPARVDSEEDFRHISHRELMAAGSERFAAEGVSSFGPLLFDVAREQLFVGARDNLFRLSLRGLRPLERASWPAPPDRAQLCQDKGQSEDACRNYIKVLLSDGARLFSCGTSAFSPACSWRALENVSAVLDWVQGVAKCPYDPRANITALMTMEGQYYVGTPTDFSGSDYAVYRALGPGLTLRTSQYNSKWLNEPQFVGSFEDDKFVYFVFREAAVEYINCGKKVYSRIARVCKNDAGGQLVLRENWTTFVKARLNCSEPGDYPFYYDEVQSIEYLPQQRILYAAFTTPSNSIAGSAICMYNMSAIEEAFRGPFKHQDHDGSAWESRSARHHSHMHCQLSPSRSQQLAESSRYQLMDSAVQAASLRPLHTSTLQRYSLLTAAILPPSSSAPPQHLLFVATLEGLVKKISVLPEGDVTCVIEIWRPELGGAPVRAMQYLKETDSVYLGTEDGVIRVPSARCGRWGSRGVCLAAQDPQCGWDERRELCTPSPPAPHPHWLQDPPGCPRLHSLVDGGWSAWSPWEVCLQRAGEGEEERAEDRCWCQARHCDAPAPRGGGRACTGASMRVANCTQHGAWTAWSGWSACSASCGVAVKWRRRSCGAPAPAHGGRLCVGPDRQEIYCTQNPPCPAPVVAVAEPGWGEWSAWSPCSAACGGGARWRSRRCDSPSPVPGGAPCQGCPTQAEPCNTQTCDMKRATAWTPWISVHSNSSDTGVEKRYRFSCKAQSSENIKISLSKEEERPRAGSDGTGSGGGWGPWEGWGECTAGCGGGQQRAGRACLQPPCEGASTTQRACNTHSCVDGWGCWSEWSECSSSCGAGRSQRRRSCLLSSGCPGSGLQTRHCQGPPCAEAVGWSEWSSWSPCEGEREQQRTRQCLLQDGACLGVNVQTRLCIYDEDEFDNELHALAARRPPPTVLVAGGPGGAGGAGAGGPWALVGAVLVGMLCGVFIAAAGYMYTKRRHAGRIPSSPHYITQQNSYVSVPLKEVPKKRQPSFSGPRSPGGSGGFTLSKANNLSGDRGVLGTPKPYPKAMAGDYEGATMKRNSNGPCRNNMDLEQEKFY